MKGIFLTTLFILSTYATSVLAQDFSCNGLASELMVAENALMTTKLNACEVDPDSGNLKTKYCCNPKEGHEDSCMTLDQATRDYNQAMADLIIIEGIIAITSSVEANAKALQKITPKKIQEAKSQAKDFLDSVEKAKFIDLMLNESAFNQIYTNTPGEKRHFIIADYEGKTPEQLKEHIQKKCEDSTVTSYKELCDEVKILNSDKEEMVYKTLQGFSEVSKTNGYDKKSDFEKFQKYLKIEVGGVSKTYSEVAESEIYKNIEAIQTETDPKKILNLSKKLSSVKVNLGLPTELADTDIIENKFKKEIGSSLEKVQKMSQSLLDVEQNKDELIKMSKQLNAVSTSSHASFEKDFNALKANSFTRECANKTDDECYKLMLKSPKYNELGINSLKIKKDNSDKVKGTGLLLASLSACYQDPSLEKVLVCQKQAMAESKYAATSLSEARAKVAKAKEKMNFLYEGEPLKFLQMNKMHLYQSYSKEQCDKEDSSQKFQDISYCNSSDLNGLILSSSTLKEVNGLLLNMERKSFNQMLEEEYGSSSLATYNQYRDQILTQCKNSNEKPGKNLCHYLASEKGQYQKQLNEQKAYVVKYENQKKNELRIQQRLKEEKREERNRGFNAAMSGLAQVAVTGAPQIMQAHIETQNVKSMTENYRQSVIYQQKYQNWLNQQQQYYGNLYSQNPYMNYGWGFYNSNNASSFNYPNNNYTFYQHGTNQFNFSQFNFLPMSYADMATPATSISTGGSYTGTTTGTMTTTTTGDFGFSF